MKLLDRYSTPSDEDERRHRCEVLYIIEKRNKLGPERGRAWADEYMERVKKKRGNDAAVQLWLDAKRQWALGNRGGKHWLVEVSEEDE